MGSHASLESIVEEPVSGSLEIPPTQVTSDPTPKSTREHERATATQPQGWNGKKGITTSRAMRDVCGIWYVRLFGSGTISPSGIVTPLFGTALSPP
jgi:hypothetical protein